MELEEIAEREREREDDGNNFGKYVGCKLSQLDLNLNLVAKAEHRSTVLRGLPQLLSLDLIYS